MNYIDEGSTLPVPFNMFPTPKSCLCIGKTLRDLLLFGNRRRRQHRSSSPIDDHHHHHQTMMMTFTSSSRSSRRSLNDPTVTQGSTGSNIMLLVDKKTRTKRQNFIKVCGHSISGRILAVHTTPLFIFGVKVCSGQDGGVNKLFEHL